MKKVAQLPGIKLSRNLINAPIYELMVLNT
jgi:hypothetical protein